MQKPETKFRAWLRPRLEELPDSFWESIQQKTIIGTPDILGCVVGWFCGLELKASARAEISALQKLKLERINAAGGIARVVFPENAEEVLTFLRGLKNVKNQLG